jgi:hypothetical protein
MAKTMRARPAWLFRRCPIGNDFPTVLHVEVSGANETGKFARVRISSPAASTRFLRAADLHQRCIGPCSCFSSLQPVPLPVPEDVTSHRRVPYPVTHGVPLTSGEKGDSCSRR